MVGLTEPGNRSGTDQSRPVQKKFHRLGSASRLIVVLASIAALIGWGAFAVTTITPNPNDSTNVFGAFQAKPPFQWQDDYNLPPGSTVEFVFNIRYTPNSGSCGGFKPATTASNGTWVVGCTLPKPNSTLTAGLSDYVDFIIKPGCCIQQTYFSWVSGPTGNLTWWQSNGGFFKADQEGNYTMHISNTNYPPPPAYPPGHVPGTLTFSLGYVTFSRPYFVAGIVTLAVAAGFSAYSLYQASLDLKRRKTSEQADPGRKLRKPSVPPEMSD